MLTPLVKFEQDRERRFSDFVHENRIKVIDISADIEEPTDVDKFFDKLLPFLGDDFIGHSTEFFQEGIRRLKVTITAVQGAIEIYFESWQLFHVVDILDPINDYLEGDELGRFLGQSTVSYDSWILVLLKKSELVDFIKKGFPPLANYGKMLSPELRTEDFKNVSFLLLEFDALPEITMMREALCKAIKDLNYRIYDFMAIGYDDVHLLMNDGFLTMIVQDCELGSYRASEKTIHLSRDAYSLLLVYAIYGSFSCKLTQNFQNGVVEDMSYSDFLESILGGGI